MICVLVGITPTKEEVWDSIRNNVTSVNGVQVKWRGTFSLVPDEDNAGALTLIMAASVFDDDHGSFDPQAVVDAVEKYISLKMKDEMDDGKKAGDFSCEMWASAPGPLPLKATITGVTRSNNDHHDEYEYEHKYDHDLDHDHDGYAPITRAFVETTHETYKGQKGVIKLDDEVQVQRASQIMKEWGMVLQPNILTSSQIQELRTIVYEAIEEVEYSLSVHRPDIIVGKDIMCFREIASRSLGRFDLRLTSSTAMDFVERVILGRGRQKNNPLLVSFLQRILLAEENLNDIDFDVSVVYSRPGADAQGWHADGSHQKGANDAGWDDDGWKTNLSHSYAFCLFIPLIDLDDETGFTQFWPGSHRSRDLIGFGKVAEVTHSTLDAKGPAGCGIWYDYRLLHRGMPNRSDVLRPVVQVIFKKKWYVERSNYGLESIIAGDHLKEALASSSKDSASTSVESDISDCNDDTL